MSRRLAFAAALLATSLPVLAVPAHAGTTVDAVSVVDTYLAIGKAKFADTASAAHTLDAAINAFLAKPTQEGLEAARKAWIAARIPYSQAEAYRFGNPEVDRFEGKVNSWPLDEGLIDYVDASYGSESDVNALYAANVIANKEIKIGGKPVDLSVITPELLEKTLNKAGNVDANVATGYHAIEFLLWGQDLNGTGPGAGNRPYTDYDLKACTHGNCDRRAAYLKAASSLLVRDADEVAAAFTDGGEAFKRIKALTPGEALTGILTGIGSLSYGELAGERMKLGVLLHDPEEEQDCFSDNTHAEHLNDVIGILGVYYGTYTRTDGTVIKGASLADLVKAKDGTLAGEVDAAFAKTKHDVDAIVERAKTTEAYDQMLAEGNEAGNKVILTTVDDLIAQTRLVQRVVTALDLGALEVEGSASLDDPSKVKK